MRYGSGMWREEKRRGVDASNRSGAPFLTPLCHVVYTIWHLPCEESREAVQNWNINTIILSNSYTTAYSQIITLVSFFFILIVLLFYDLFTNSFEFVNRKRLVPFFYRKFRGGEGFLSRIWIHWLLPPSCAHSLITTPCMKGGKPNSPSSP